MKENVNLVHYEADMFFVDPKSEEYFFDPNKIPSAHEWCQTKTREALKLGISVVVSNTFIQKWEMRPYINMAKDFGADLEIKVMNGRFSNIHGVPESKIENMLKRWESHDN
jgi:hypothetical protein